MAGALGRASHGRIAARSVVGNREEGGEGSAWLARLGAPRTAESPCSTEAHCKVTTHFSLPSSPYSLPSRTPFSLWRGQ